MPLSLYFPVNGRKKAGDRVQPGADASRPARASTAVTTLPELSMIDNYIDEHR
jgi:hypothetical protein